MPELDIPRDKHAELSADDDAVQRGTNQQGEPDSHTGDDHSQLPADDPNYQPRDTSARIEQMLREDKPRRRAQTLFPYLMIRAVPGDRGARPLWEPTVCWESCDIHLMPAGQKFDFGSTVLKPVVGSTYTIFVHVWNLGRMAAYGARLRVWWVEPGFFNGTPDPRYQPHFIGGSYFDLGDRDSGQSHRLIEVGAPWTVTGNAPAHECLLAAVECATDPWDGVLDSNGHRHVAQRNLDLISSAQSLTPLLGALLSKFGKTETRLTISHAAVGKASLQGAFERGLSASRETGRGWDHGGLALDASSTPLASVAGDQRGLLFHDLRAAEPGKLLPDTVIKAPLGKALPGLLQKQLGTADLSAASILGALGPPTAPRVLRLVVADSRQRENGYSIIVAP